MKTSVNSFIFLGMACGFLACQAEKQQEKDYSEIVLRNTSRVKLNEKPVILKRDQIKGLPDEELFPLVTQASGDTLPTQLDDVDGDGQWDELFILADFAAQEEKTVQLKWVDQPIEFEKRTSVRFGKREAADQPVQPAQIDTLPADGLPKSVGYQPYQTDGPSWENDKVGFRHYFDGRNAKDLFGKKVSHMSPETVGINSEGAVEDNYHVMEDWGRDILAVGNSLGIGGFALMIDEAPARLGVTVDDAVNNVEESVFQIVKEGPIRSIIQYNYNNWQTHNRNYDVQERTTIWPGMYGYKNEVSISGLQGDEIFLVGLVNINNDQPLEEIEVNEEWVVLLTHDKQSYDKEWHLGMALILPKAKYQGYSEAPESGDLSNSFLAKLSIEENEPISYYAIGAWGMSEEQFRDREYFKNYVTNLTKQLDAEVEVSWK
ncbi:DUF4861 domain-containing protein [Echinicola jeungdonensis]|uniref:DUF4861 domain-containing protein n=1 Tax=Echinicola jeungdonensis TaxID=709343 RepID=A0ABV5J4X6_9BACT|nr:DUF4861 domain-containing protein [Echinicola jeungdonensis]MDN3669528.1 DUF4861 domain-containing protein [Echinicola jeungdonensis]